MSGLRIAPGFSLPLDVAGEAVAILAKRGAGKTNTATVLVEELVAADVQTVIVDPVGAWWGIRSSASGEKGAGLAVPILGGQHGDVSLEQTAGALIADVVVDSGQSLLLDLSDFPSKAAIARFVIDFAERLYRRKGRSGSLLHLVLEEADEFAPQAQRADTARMRGAMEQIVRRGRSRGLGVTLITQRSAVLNKDVLTQADVLIVMRTTGPHDVKAIREWVAARGDEHGESVIESLPSLKTGEAWVWNPERGLLERVMVRHRRTFDSSETPKAGQKRAEPGDVAPIDLAALGEQIQATAEKAKADDPRELRKRVRELERQLAERPTETKVETVTETVEVPVLANGAVDKLNDAVKAIATVGADLCAAAAEVATEIRRVQVPAPPPRVRPAPAATKTIERAARPAPQRERAPEPDGDFALASGHRRILDALAWLEATLGVTSANRIQISFLAGYRPSSGGFNNLLGALRTAALISYPGAGFVALTDAGRELTSAPSPGTAEDLQEAVLSKLNGSQGKILRVLLAAYPEPLAREAVAEQTGYSSGSGGFNNLLGSMRSLGIIGYPAPGEVAALPVLFLE